MKARLPLLLTLVLIFIVGATGTAHADTFPGTDGADNLVGTQVAADLLQGFSGTDRIDGRAGPDTIEGGRGDDLVLASSGLDDISTGAGDDHLILDVNQNGTYDTVATGTGTDFCYGSAGYQGDLPCEYATRTTDYPTWPIGDSDGDGFPSDGFFEDNCKSVYNPQQVDTDHDGTGDACE
jgi:Ca2+-binding RTX toxin-like protein